MEAGRTPQGTRLTREDLYERVWAEPMATLAPQFGFSDVWLKKVCVRMRVPTPPRGYWARKAAGQQIKRTPLPKLPKSVKPETLALEFTRPPQPKPVREAEETGPVAEQRRYEDLPEHRIQVADQLAAPHSLVAASVHLLRNSKADAEQRLLPRGKRCLALRVTLGTVDRALRVYDALIKALEARGYAVAVVEEAQGPATVVRIGQDAVSVVIEERVDRDERPDAAERRAVGADRYEFVPTGRLTLRAGHYAMDVRRRAWGDGSKLRLEQQLNDVIVGLVDASEALRAERLEREARQREREAEEERRREAERRRQEEVGRVRALDASMRLWRKARAVREYVAAMRAAAEAAGLAQDAPLVAWLRWADGYADRLDPAHAVPAVPADPEPHAWVGYGAPWGTRPDDLRPVW